MPSRIQMDITVEKRRKASDLRSEGFSFQQIGDALGLTRQRAQQLVNEHDRDVDGKHCEQCGATGRPIHQYLKTTGNQQTEEYLCVKCGGIPK